MNSSSFISLAIATVPNKDKIQKLADSYGVPFEKALETVTVKDSMILKDYQTVVGINFLASIVPSDEWKKRREEEAAKKGEEAPDPDKLPMKIRAFAGDDEDRIVTSALLYLHDLFSISKHDPLIVLAGNSNFELDKFVSAGLSLRARLFLENRDFSQEEGNAVKMLRVLSDDSDIYSRKGANYTYPYSKFIVQTGSSDTLLAQEKILNDFNSGQFQEIARHLMTKSTKSLMTAFTLKKTQDQSLVIPDPVIKAVHFFDGNPNVRTFVTKNSLILNKKEEQVLEQKDTELDSRLYG